jgi:WXXGXW repeat (2 copies)
MYKRVLKSMVLTSLAVFAAAPSFAQIRVGLGPVHIRIANEAPPRARYERRPSRPDRESVWINGYWDRQDDQWAWSSGRWERPHARNTRWIRPTYRREGAAWRYEPARWSDQQLVEGEDYQQWRNDHRSDRDRRRN